MLTGERAQAAKSCRAGPTSIIHTTAEDTEGLLEDSSLVYMDGYEESIGALHLLSFFSAGWTIC